MRGGSESPPTNFRASQLCQEPFIGSILHLNFFHMGTLNDPDAKKAPKNLLYLSYTTCDEMIKKGQYQVWLRVS